MTEQKPDTQYEVAIRVLLNLSGVILFAGLIALVVATIIHEAG